MRSRDGCGLTAGSSGSGKGKCLTGGSTGCRTDSESGTLPRAHKGTSRHDPPHASTSLHGHPTTHKAHYYGPAETGDEADPGGIAGHLDESDTYFQLISEEASHLARQPIGNLNTRQAAGSRFNRFA